MLSVEVVHVAKLRLGAAYCDILPARCRVREHTLNVDGVDMTEFVFYSRVYWVQKTKRVVWM